MRKAVPVKFRPCRPLLALGLLLGFAALGCGGGSGTAAPAAPAPTPSAPAARPVGLNIAAPLDWDGCLMFADAMKSARDWERPGTSEPAAVDADGWPTEDAQCAVWAGIQGLAGTYRLSFRGHADVAFEWSAAAVRNLAYDAASGVTTADVDVSGDDRSALRIVFTGSTGGVRDVSLMRPTTPGGAQSYPAGTLFTDPFKAALAPVSTLRFMDFTATNWNQQVHWSDRVLPTQGSFARTAPGYGWQGRGGPWEYVVRLANELHKDAWICVPVKADDDYVLQLAKLFRDGDAATGGRGLDPSLKLYVEFSNEVWNDGFGQSVDNLDLALAEHDAGDAGRYDYDGVGRGYGWGWRRVARRIVDISRTFRQVFGDGAMMTRIRPVFCWQAVRKVTGHDPLVYLEEAYLPSIAPGRPVSDFIWGGGGSGYYNPDNGSDALTLDGIWSSQSMDVATWGRDAEDAGRQAYNAALCRAFGLKRVAYEGGPSLDRYGHSEDVKAAAAADPRMKTAVVAHHQAWDRWDGDLFMYFTLAGDYQWGFCQDVLHTDTPKMQALKALAAGTPEAVTLGAPVPAAFTGNGFDLSPVEWEQGGAPGPRTVQDGRWLGFLVRVPADGSYPVSATVPDGSGTLVVQVDGVEAASAPAAGNPSLHIPLSKGLHCIRLRARGGSFTLGTVTVGAAN